MYSLASVARVRTVMRAWPLCVARLTTTTAQSFIERVKASGANALLGVFTATQRFDQTMSGLEVTRISSGVVHAKFMISEAVANSYGTLHGGATATLVDIMGTMALLTMDPTRAGVTVELSASYISAAKIGEEIQLVGRVLKTGKRLGFTDVVITRGSDGAIVASGRHTKAL